MSDAPGDEDRGGAGDAPALDRRRLLAGLAGVAAVGGAAAVSTGGLGGDRPADTVDTLAAAGSSAGRLRLPVRGTPTLLDLFATWCAPCAEQMPALAAVHDAYGDRVRFVSVTNERFGGGLDADAVRAWWREHDGAWTLGHDPDGSLMRALGVGALPHLALFDAAGRVAWRHGSVASERRLRAELAAVATD